MDARVDVQESKLVHFDWFQGYITSVEFGKEEPEMHFRVFQAGEEVSL